MTVSSRNRKLPFNQPCLPINRTAKTSRVCFPGSSMYLNLDLEYRNELVEHESALAELERLTGVDVP